jgi:argininosuccinate synthase
VRVGYSGGLDTSIIVSWLRENYGCEVICVTADLGQEEELDGLEAKSVGHGASKIYIEDTARRIRQRITSRPQGRRHL